MSTTSSVHSSSTSSTSSSSSGDEHSRSMYFEDAYDLSVFLYGGEFGEYYRCINRETSRKHMVKIIKPLKHWSAVESPPPRCVSPDAVSVTAHRREHFSREGVIWRRLKHRNIVELIRMFKSSKEQFLVTEYIKDGYLFDYLCRFTAKPYTERDVCYFVRQILDAVAYLRTKRVIHRDITPDNLLVRHGDVGNDVVVKLCGFGLSLRLDKHQKFIRTEPKGVPLHLSPETLHGKPINYAVDIWSVGVALFTLLFGNPPFWKQRTPTQLYSAILNGDIYPCCWEDVSDHARDLLNKMLEINPALRITGEKALNHSWFAEHGSVNRSRINRKKTIEKLREFNKSRKAREPLFVIDTQLKVNECNARNSDLIGSSYGEKRRTKQYEQARQTYGSVLSRPTVISVSSHNKLPQNDSSKIHYKARAATKVSLRFSSRRTLYVR